jgi:hypothetical protein
MQRSEAFAGQRTGVRTDDEGLNVRAMHHIALELGAQTIELKTENAAALARVLLSRLAILGAGLDPAVFDGVPSGVLAQALADRSRDTPTGLHRRAAHPLRVGGSICSGKAHAHCGMCGCCRLGLSEMR